MVCFFFVSILEEQCHPSPCGQNTKCEVVGGTPTCSCLHGYTGSPLSGCRHECETDGECGGQEMCKDFKCASSCSQCGQGAVCSRVTNHRAVCECPKVKLMTTNNHQFLIRRSFSLTGLHRKSIW